MKRLKVISIFVTNFVLLFSFQTFAQAKEHDKKTEPLNEKIEMTGQSDKGNDTSNNEVPGNPEETQSKNLTEKTPSKTDDVNINSNEKKDEIKSGFRFGSYGRISIGTTTEGRSILKYEIVGHPQRIFENNYVEIDLGYNLDTGINKYVKILMTTAIMGNFFHYTGDPQLQAAVRNLYIEAKGYPVSWLAVWVGSRMYRGDDIYLLDFWPMDNLNTLGAGLITSPGLWDFRIHAGVNRLNDEFQYQEIKVAAEQFQPRTVVFMDRQRFISSLKITRFFLLSNGWEKGAKVSIYGEVHGLPAGYLYHENEPPEKIPSDFGWLVGIQGGIWGFSKDSWANVWLKYSGGLASYGELSIPFDLQSDKKSTSARDFIAGISSNWEFGYGGIITGFYARYFKDADPNVYDINDYWEGVLTVRLQMYPVSFLHVAVEAGESFRQTTGLANTMPKFDPQSQSFIPPPHETPSVTNVALMLIYSPFGKGTFTRPQLRLLGPVQIPNAAARHLYPEEDIRAGGDKIIDNLIWGIGVQAEWWFNSSYR